MTGTQSGLPDKAGPDPEIWAAAAKHAFENAEGSDPRQPGVRRPPYMLVWARYRRQAFRFLLAVLMAASALRGLTTDAAIYSVALAIMWDWR